MAYRRVLVRVFFNIKMMVMIWYGSAQIPNLRLGQTANLQIILSLRGKLPQLQQYIGTLERFGSQEAAVKEIRSNQPVRYRVRFPIQSRLPKLTRIMFNGRILCTGQPETGPYITQITLNHNLYTKKAARYYAESDLYSPQYPTQPSLRPSDGSQSESEICGRPHGRFQIAPLVVGGESVSRGAWPWLVAVYLIKPTGLTFNCGGNLVSSKVVVSAAHCFRTSDRTYSANDVILSLGRYNILSWTEKGSIMAEVEKLIIHNDYMSRDTSYDADIAISMLRYPVQYNEYIRPICLWDGSDDLHEIVGSMGTVVGWGRDGSGNVVSPEPKKINIPVVSEAACLRSSDAYRCITSNRTFCAGGRDGKGPCNGDSGTGMIMVRNKRWHLRGIVSAALADPVINVCNLGDYIMCTDAAKFVDWIRFYMR